eukprot:COSAG01_NODE_61293_length_290_cov_0.816754_1_plen_52_part_10
MDIGGGGGNGYGGRFPLDGGRHNQAMLAVGDPSTTGWIVPRLGDACTMRSRP